MEEKPRLKISVLCASRKNVSNLRTIIGALDMLSSGKHDINYVVSCDWDDLQTQRAVERMVSDRLPVTMSCKQRRSCLGAAWNDAAFSSLADVYALVTDRALAVTPLWDAYIADAYGKDNTRVTWWTTNAGPVIPIVPHKWLDVVGQIYTEYFPFWFDDTWLHELSALVHGLPNFMLQASCFIYKKDPKTKRMRDLRFWMDFFIAKRQERIEHAVKIRETFGVVAPDLRPVEEWFKQQDELWTREWQKWESIATDSSEPDEEYIKAKKAAEEFMNVKANSA